MAFHPDPQLIRADCNPLPVRPSTTALPVASPWPRIDRLGFASIPHATSTPYVRLAFPTAPALQSLTSLPLTITRRLIMQKARRRPSSTAEAVHSSATACRTHGFRDCFTPLVGVLFTFPSRYWFTIGRSLVLSLGRWSSQIPAGFHVSRRTQVRQQQRSIGFRVRGFHPLWPPFPEAVPLSNDHAAGWSYNLPRWRPATPHRQRCKPITSVRFGLFPVRSPLLRESRLMSSPRGT